MSEPYIWRVACGAWREYKAKRRPTCGCQKCWDKWRKANTIRYMEMGHDD